MHGKEKVKIDISTGIKRNEIEIILTKQFKVCNIPKLNGIPQGSVLMDFIVEMVLGYADAALICKIKNYNRKEERYKIEDYQILRYRDDYRIFATLIRKR